MLVVQPQSVLYSADQTWLCGPSSAGWALTHGLGHPAGPRKRPGRLWQPRPGGSAYPRALSDEAWSHLLTRPDAEYRRPVRPMGDEHFHPVDRLAPA